MDNLFSLFNISKLFHWRENIVHSRTAARAVTRVHLIYQVNWKFDNESPWKLGS